MVFRLQVYLELPRGQGGGHFIRNFLLAHDLRAHAAVVYGVEINIVALAPLRGKGRAVIHYLDRHSAVRYIVDAAGGYDIVLEVV